MAAREPSSGSKSVTRREFERALATVRAEYQLELCRLYTLLQDVPTWYSDIAETRKVYMAAYTGIYRGGAALGPKLDPWIEKSPLTTREITKLRAEYERVFGKITV